MDSKQEALIQLVYEDLMEDRFAMEASLFSRWWERALFLLLVLFFLPFFPLLYVWESLLRKKEKVDE